MLQNLCMPALIYLIYSMTHVIIDMYKEEYSKAMIEFWMSVIFTLLLNILCQRGLGIISWLIVSIPFILMTTIATLLMFSFEVNPATGEPLEKTETETKDETLKPSKYAYPIVAHYKDTHPASYDSKDKYTTIQTPQTQQCQAPQTQQTPQTSQTSQTSQSQQPQQVASISYQMY